MPEYRIKALKPKGYIVTEGNKDTFHSSMKRLWDNLLYNTLYMPRDRKTKVTGMEITIKVTEEEPTD